MWVEALIEWSVPVSFSGDFIAHGAALFCVKLSSFFPCLFLVCLPCFGLLLPLLCVFLIGDTRNRLNMTREKIVDNYKGDGDENGLLGSFS